jgi:hypothetical protein
MSVCCECWVLSGRGLCGKLDHSSKGVLPTVLRRCVWFRILIYEEPNINQFWLNLKIGDVFTHAINTDRQHSCWMSSDRLHYTGRRKNSGETPNASTRHQLEMGGRIHGLAVLFPGSPHCTCSTGGKVEAKFHQNLLAGR